MPIVDNVIGIVRGINDRRREARVEDAIRKNWMTSPDTAIAEAIQADPKRGLALQEQQIARTTAAEEQRRKRLKENTDTFSQYLRGAKPGTDYGALIDQMTPFFKNSLGANDEEISNFKTAITANPEILAGLDPETYKLMSKDRYTDTVATPGSYVRRGGETVEAVPYAPKPVVLRDGNGRSEMRLFNPNEYLPGLNGSDSGGGGGGVAATPQRGGGIDPNGPGVAPPGGGVPDNEAAQILNDAQQNKVIGQSDARVIRDSLGPNGQTAYNNWLKQNGIRVVPDGTAARAPVPQGGDLPVQRVQPAPAMRSGQVIGAPTAPKTPKRLRPATPEELRGYPPGTAAQVDESTGELKNLRTPPAASQPKPLSEKDRTAIEKQVTQAEDLVSSMTRLEAQAKRLMDHPGASAATGMVAGRLPGISQQATNFVNEFNNLKQVVGLEAMKALKALSASGATGFGNMSNAEGVRIENMLGALERTSDLPSLRRVYQQIIDFAREKRTAAAKGIMTTRQRLSGGSAAPAARSTGARMGQTATDSATGRKIILDNGGWVWMDTGEPYRPGKKK